VYVDPKVDIGFCRLLPREVGVSTLENCTLPPRGSVEQNEGMELWDGDGIKLSRERQDEEQER
jgi:hypothetical protein